MLQAFWLAVQFLSRLPTPEIKKINGPQVGASVLFYPVVGLVIGCLLAAVGWLSQGVNQYLHSALILLAWVFISGGLHLDGLADCADAWAGGLGNRERSLEIMKDPAAGPIAVIVLILVLLIKWSALISITANQEFMKLLMIPLMGRLAILLLMLTTPYIRKNGLGEVMNNNLPVTSAWSVVVVSILVSIWNLGLLVVVLAGLAFWLLRRLALQRLGGTTGDVYGAVLEVIEVVTLIAVVW